jgi:uncharacterized membrane protein
MSKKNLSVIFVGIVIFSLVIVFKIPQLIKQWITGQKEIGAQAGQAQEYAAETQSATAANQASDALQAANTQAGATVTASENALKAQQTFSSAWQNAVANCNNFSSSSWGGSASILGVGGSASGSSASGGCVSG